MFRGLSSQSTSQRLHRNQSKKQQKLLGDSTADTKNKVKIRGSNPSLTQSPMCVPCPVTSSWELLLGISDLHGALGRNPEALQCIFGHSRLALALKLYKGDVVFAGDESHLFETRESMRKKRNHGYIERGEVCRNQNCNE